MRILRYLCVGIVSLVVIVIAAALIWRAYWQHRIAQEVRITSPGGIDEAQYVDINGAREWITIRGDDRRNPAVLFLHGGPSEANSPLIPLYLPFEKHYVFVQWDQPGAGMTYIAARNHQPALTIEGMARDGIAVAEYVRNRLHQPKIVLIGQDWGGLLGIRMIEQRPDLFSAFVGTGQLVGVLAAQSPQYRYALDQATTGHDEAMLAALKQVGPPPWRTREQYGQFQNCCRKLPAEDTAGVGRLMAMLGLSPSLSIRQTIGWYQALRTNEDTLDRLLLASALDLRETDTKLPVPVFFIQGADDTATPTSLVADYAAQIEAPVKGINVVPGAGHFIMWTSPEAFLRYLDADLHLAARSGG